MVSYHDLFKPKLQAGLAGTFNVRHILIVVTIIWEDLAASIFRIAELKMKQQLPPEYC